MPDHVRSLDAERVEYAGHVAYRVGQRVAGHLGRATRPPEPPHVRRDRTEAMPGEERDLVPPQVGRVRPAVDEQHRGALAMVLDVERDPLTSMIMPGL